MNEEQIVSFRNDDSKITELFRLIVNQFNNLAIPFEHNRTFRFKFISNSVNFHLLPISHTISRFSPRPLNCSTFNEDVYSRLPVSKLCPTFPRFREPRFNHFHAIQNYFFHSAQNEEVTKTKTVEKSSKNTKYTSVFKFESTIVLSEDGSNKLNILPLRNMINL